MHGDNNSCWGQERVSEQSTSSIITTLLRGHQTPAVLPMYAKKKKLWQVKTNWNKNKLVEQSEVSVLSEKSFAFAVIILVSLFKEQENINGATAPPRITLSAFSLSQRAQHMNNEWMNEGFYRMDYERSNFTCRELAEISELSGRYHHFEWQLRHTRRQWRF